jgi:quercetin dioxygenase-like cupin family protein
MSRFFPNADQYGRHTIFGNIPIVTFAGEKLQLSYVEIPPGGVVEWHSHPHEQMGMVISGEVRFQIGDEERVLKGGDMYCAPGGVRHRVVALGEATAKVLDVFHPVRDDYR